MANPPFAAELTGGVKQVNADNLPASRPGQKARADSNKQSEILPHNGASNRACFGPAAQAPTNARASRLAQNCRPREFPLSTPLLVPSRDQTQPSFEHQ